MWEDSSEYENASGGGWGGIYKNGHNIFFFF